MAELYLPRATDWIGAYEAGNKARMVRDDTAARREAGGLMTSGDYAGAAAKLYGRGDLSGGVQIANYARQATQNAAADKDAERKRQLAEFQTTYGVLRNIDTQEQLDQLKADPSVTQMIPDIATADLSKVQRVKDIGSRLFPEETVVVSPGSALVGKESGSRVYEQPKVQEPKWVERTNPDGSTEWFDINQGGPEASAPAPSEDWLGGVASAAPDAQVTSGYRTPEHNAKVGGVPTSRHMTGEAVDLVPKPGETMAQLHARVSKVPGVRAINEGDHVHVQRTAPSSSGRTIRGDAADPMKALQRENLQGQITDRQQKASDLADKKVKETQSIRDQSNLVIGAVDQALGMIGRGEAGLVGSYMSKTPGTKAYDVSRMIETIKANLSFSELQRMRAASPTGGALGAISDREIGYLGSTIASLDIGQSEAQLRQNLEQIKRHYQAWKATVDQAGGQGAPAAGASDPLGIR